MAEPVTDVLIVGAGLTGLTCARALQRAGRDVVVLDKGRRPGGRAAWRDGKAGTFAHGLPWMDEGAPEGWRRWDAAGGAAVPPEGLGRWIDAHAAPVAPVQAATVTEIAAPGDGHVVTASLPEGRRRWRARTLVLTVPVPQAIALWPATVAVAPDARMAPGWTLMAAFDAETGIDPARAPVGDRAIPEHLRPGGTGPRERWTLQLGPEATTPLLDLTRDAAVAPLMARLAELAGGDLPKPVQARAHRWLYSHPTAPQGAGALEAEGVWLGGDWTLAEGRADAARSAIASGRALAAALGA